MECPANWKPGWLITSQKTSIIKKIISKFFIQQVRNLVFVRSEGYNTDYHDSDVLGYYDEWFDKWIPAFLKFTWTESGDSRFSQDAGPI
jgi:hypothetical protein